MARVLCTLSFVSTVNPLDHQNIVMVLPQPPNVIVEVRHLNLWAHRQRLRAEEAARLPYKSSHKYDVVTTCAASSVEEFRELVGLQTVAPATINYMQNSIYF